MTLFCVIAGLEITYRDDEVALDEAWRQEREDRERLTQLSEDYARRCEPLLLLLVLLLLIELVVLLVLWVLLVLLMLLSLLACSCDLTRSLPRSQLGPRRDRSRLGRNRSEGRAEGVRAASLTQ